MVLGPGYEAMDSIAWKGFQSDGSNCVDINECITSGACDSNALCQNTSPGYTCECKRPYFYGDGFNCYYHGRFQNTV